MSRFVQICLNHTNIIFDLHDQKKPLLLRLYPSPSSSGMKFASGTTKMSQIAAKLDATSSGSSRYNLSSTKEMGSVNVDDVEASITEENSEGSFEERYADIFTFFAVHLGAVWNEC